MTDNTDVLRAKWTMDGAATLSEAAEMLRDFADHVEELEREGWQLTEPVSDDYGELGSAPKESGRAAMPINIVRNKAPFTVKQTEISWRKLWVVTAQANDSNLLRPYHVFVIDCAGSPKSPTAVFATAAAADNEHQKLVRQLTTGERNSA